MKLSNEERISEVIGFTKKDKNIIFTPYIPNIFNLPTSPITGAPHLEIKKKYSVVENEINR